MILLFREIAEAELGDAIAYYDGIDSGLALRFQDAIDSALLQISEYPESYQIVHADLRRGKVDRFPHVLYYRVVRGELVVVVACIHPARDPALWLKRR